MNIRYATREDGERVIALLAEIADYHHEGRPDIFKSNFTKYSMEEYYELLTKKDERILVCEDNGQVIGYAICQIKEIKDSVVRNDSRYLYLDDLCVTKEKRRSGAGRALIEAVKKMAAELDCEKVELNVWNFEGSAMDFYEKCGMRPMCTHMEVYVK